MFERYTEYARRTIFFARYEASLYGSAHIAPEHLLLGVLREDKPLAAKLPIATAKIHIESRLKRPFEKLPTSVDLPLSGEAKQALHYAAEEAAALGNHFIDTLHLALGLLRLETSLAAEILRGAGLDGDAIRALPSRPPGRPPDFETAYVPPLVVSAPALDETIHRLHSLVEGAKVYLRAFWERDAAVPLRHREWTRKEALGHLIDLATAHHQWFARALVDPKLTAAGYPDEAWVKNQKYADHPWIDLVEAWVALNTLLVRVLARVPETKLETPCRIGIADPITLAQLIAAYADRTTGLLGEILTRG
jgi:hypothetical protein